MKRIVVMFVLAFACGLAVNVTPAAAVDDEGWTIPSFAADYTVNTDGSLNVVEDIQVDFGSQEHHGIYRDLDDWLFCTAAAKGSEPRLTPCSPGQYRSYAMTLTGVADEQGKPQQWLLIPADGSPWERIRIGDPGVTVSGKQWYHLAYTVHGALDAYASGDELYWNATGLDWAAHSIDEFKLTLHLPAGATPDLHCFEGPKNSTEACASVASGNTVHYEAKRSLAFGEGVTIVARWQKGVVNVEAPYIDARPGMTGDAPQPETTDVTDFFTLDLVEFGGMGLVAIATIALLWAAWYRHGRDRTYKSLYYLTNDPDEHARPLREQKDIVVEFLPPDNLRPAEMGLILDERADTLDVTATIVDLAVRGFLHITEIPREGLLGHADWQLANQGKDTTELQPYEKSLLSGLFESGDNVKMSGLKDKFVARLETVKSALYDDAMDRKWFDEKPEKTRGVWLTAAIGFIALGPAGCFFSGYYFGRALIFVPVLLGGLALLVVARAMARRTATGSEALRRVLGFRLYISTAETRRQEFNEQKNIFERYLPFAIVFGCVSKWAKAFEGLDDEMSSSTNSWYTSTHPFQVAAFASGLQSFSSSVSSNISSSPSSSGGSGGGGSSGGGGGGGGGGSW
jgi:Predicted membrane protein (DUF2207)